MEAEKYLKNVRDIDEFDKLDIIGHYETRLDVPEAECLTSWFGDYALYEKANSSITDEQINNAFKSSIIALVERWGEIDADTTDYIKQGFSVSEAAILKRFDELSSCWGNETDEEWTQGWRNELYDWEQELVECWDKGFQSGIQKALEHYETNKTETSNIITEKPRLFVDMDGTIARFHDEINYLEQMYEPGFFRRLKPFENSLDGIRQFIAGNTGYDVYILSAAISEQCEAEKQDWLNEHLPEIDTAHRIFVSPVESKFEALPKLRSTDILFDDYNKNLEEWQAHGGTAVKCKNNINHKGLHGELWEGRLIDIADTPESISEQLHNIVNEPNNKITVLVVEPGKAPQVTEIDNTLESMQKIVGGYIEAFQLDKNTALWCNEEGKINNLPYNRAVGNDVIAGTFFIAGDAHDGESCSLNKEQISKYTDMFANTQPPEVELTNEHLTITFI